MIPENALEFIYMKLVSLARNILGNRIFLKLDPLKEMLGNISNYISLKKLI